MLAWINKTCHSPLPSAHGEKEHVPTIEFFSKHNDLWKFFIGKGQVVHFEALWKKVVSVINYDYSERTGLAEMILIFISILQIFQNFLLKLNKSFLHMPKFVILRPLSVLRLYSIDDKMINEYGTVGGIRPAGVHMPSYIKWFFLWWWWWDWSMGSEILHSSLPLKLQICIQVLERSRSVWRT
jgi:hypothetical protein